MREGNKYRTVNVELNVRWQRIHPRKETQAGGHERRALAGAVVRAMVKLGLLLLADWTETSKNQIHEVTPMLPSRPPANHDSVSPSIRPGRRRLPALLALWTLTASPLHQSASLSLQKVLKSPLGLVQTCLCQWLPPLQSLMK